MTTRWKALEEHFLVVPLVFQFGGKDSSTFSELFFSRNLQPVLVLTSYIIIPDSTETFWGFQRAATKCLLDQ
jgi:hypothetical protein